MLDNKRDDICPKCNTNKYVTTLYHPRGTDCPMRLCHNCWHTFKAKQEKEHENNNTITD